ncbi:hypothetical protein NP233_g2517 [Leucocoprinus birnbaumii]|uniref:MI domain-containing protein n=1 Tax=Leucocoprinus birnbaumii TaxID=56174 RepID=A0AAD5W264_9AGAR|nr:hypothetical protein NP233_g2517 [Leucocoprinus birnbaumii]
MSAAVLSTARDEGVTYKRKRSRSPSEEVDDVPPASRRRSRSPSSRSRKDLPRVSVSDVDPIRKAERERQLTAHMAAMELQKMEESEKAKKDKEKDDAQAEFAKLTSLRSSGVYVPPARLRAMQEAAAKDKSSPEYQRITWDALRKSITGIVNRVNIANIKEIVPELFSENLIRGRGLFARSIMKAQAASLPFTPVFAAVVSIVNTKLPQVGELVLTRLISQFRRAFKRNDKIVCHSSTTFIGHLVNQAVAHEIIALEILVLLLERPTDDSIEIAVGFMREVGAFLAENSPKANATVYERFRAVLNEGNISQRVQYMIEVLMQVRKDKYKDNPIIPEGLDLVEEDDQITHQIQLAEELQVQDGLNIFKFDPNYLENEEKYKAIKAEILGEDSDEDGSDSESEESSEDEDEVVAEKEGIEDRTETNLVNLRRVIYLTIMNALNYEEAVHKLLKIQLEEGQEIELINMIIECCSQERSYSTFYGLIGERFSKLNRVWTECFETAFQNYYETIHRYETNRLRNIARFFGHLFSTDAVSWVVLGCVKVNEDDTTSSSRIFVKILMNEMMETMGLKTLAERFKDPEIRQACQGMFPMDVPKNTRFSINYFTSIGLGVLTEEMREYLKNAPRLIMEQRRAMLEAESSESDSDSDSDSDTESDSDDDSSSDVSSSGSEYSRRRRRYSSSPPRRRARSDSRSVTPPARRRARNDSRSVTPPARRRGGRDVSRSPSPPPRRGGQGRARNDLRSPSPPPRRGRQDSRTPSPPIRRRYSRTPSPTHSVSRSPPTRKRYDSPPRRGPAGGGRSPPPPTRLRRDPRDMDTRPDGPPSSRRPPPTNSPPARRRRSPSYTRGGGGGGDRRMRSASRSPPPPPRRDRERSPPPRTSRGGGAGAGDRDRDMRERSPPPHMRASGGGRDRDRATPPHMRSSGGDRRGYNRDRR